MGNVSSQNNANNAAYKNYKQKELDEAIELDRMLEIERRNQSHDIFAKKYDEKFDNYFNNIQGVPNIKNNSQSMRGIFGAAGSNNLTPQQQPLDESFVKLQQQQ